MQRPTCKTCVFWRELEFELDDGLTEGYCTRHAPKPKRHDGCGDPECSCSSEFFVQWPTTLSSEGCGEHPDFKRFIAHTGANPRWREVEGVPEKLAETDK